MRPEDGEDLELAVLAGELIAVDPIAQDARGLTVQDLAQAFLSACSLLVAPNLLGEVLGHFSQQTGSGPEDKKNGT